MRSEKEVDEFLKLLIQMDELLKEFTDLSKKKPDGPVNKFKLGLVNALLDQSNTILPKTTKPFEDFGTFDNDNLPTNSDVVVILSQYLGCLKKHGRDNTTYRDYKAFWLINGKTSQIAVDENQLRD